MSEPSGVQGWERVASELDRSYSVFRVRGDRVRSPRTGEVHHFDVVEAPDGVAVLALTAADELVLVEQFRHGTRSVSLELPSGFMDPGESPREAGLRELREETGCTADEAELLGTLDLNPSWQTTRVHVVAARGVRETGAQELDAGEDVRVLRLPRAEVLARAARGEIRSAVAVAALGLLELPR